VFTRALRADGTDIFVGGSAKDESENSESDCGLISNGKSRIKHDRWGALVKDSMQVSYHKTHVIY
jgi:hypothetical protein